MTAPETREEPPEADLPADAPGEEPLEAFLSRMVASTLEPVAGGLAVLFVVIAVIQRFAMSPPFSTVMAPYSVGMAALFGGVYATARRRGIPARWAHAVGTAFVLLVLTGTVLPFALIRDPLQATDLVLVAMGTGAVFLSRRWFVANLALVAVLFGAFVAAAPGYGRWPNLAVAVTGASVLGYVVLQHRVRILARLRELRVQDARSREELRDRMSRIERLRAEAERERDRARRYAHQLEEANEDLEQFASAVSRHLREPARSARRRLEGALAGGNGGADDLEPALQAVHQMEETTDGLVAYAEVASASGDYGPVDLDEVVSSVRGRVTERFGHEPEAVRLEALPEVVGMEGLLDRLFEEVLDNALRHGEPPVTVRGGVSEGVVRVVVDDAGPGVAPSDRKRIFRLLESGPRADGSRGAGVGLATCRRIARRLGGDIWADTSAHGGARFVLSFRPVDRIPPSRAGTAPATRPRDGDEGRAAGGPAAG